MFAIQEALQRINTRHVLAVMGALAIGCVAVGMVLGIVKGESDELDTRPAGGSSPAAVAGNDVRASDHSGVAARRVSSSGRGFDLWRLPFEGGLDATPAPTEPLVTPEAVPYLGTEGRAAVICSVMPDCQKALRVALCESGPDYSAPFDGLHVGPFEIAEKYHADKFTAHGWDYYEDGDDPYRNSVIALEILDGAGGWWPADWPFCGWK